MTNRSLMLALLCAVITPPLLAGTSIAHFFAPAYPPLARLGGIAGQVTFTVRVTPEGKIAAISETSSAHPILVDEGKRCIETWSFTGGTQESKISVTIYFGFTGAPVESNAKTTVAADFSDSSVRVYVTTNPALAHY